MNKNLIAFASTSADAAATLATTTAPAAAIKTATPFLYVKPADPERQAYFLSEAVRVPHSERRTHYVLVDVLPTTQALPEGAAPFEAFLWPSDVVGSVIGEKVGYVAGFETHAEALVQLGYVLTAPLVPSKPKRQPARTHLNTHKRTHEVTGLPLDGVPACGQLNGTKTDYAQTHYTNTPAEVTCLKCLRSRRFARAVADTLQQGGAALIPENVFVEFVQT